MEHTICAVATATGESGIGIVRISGESAIEIGRSVFQPSGADQEPEHRKMRYGHIVDRDGARLDEVLIAFFYAPNTYTREDMVEIYTHGGIMAVQTVYERLLAAGCRPAQRGEFTKRAFLNGRIDLSQAEAVQQVVSARTDTGLAAGQIQLAGGLTDRIHPLMDRTVDAMALLEHAISFSEDTDEEPVGLSALLEEILVAMEELLANKNKGRIAREGIATLILGKPNVGKSSLFNALMRENRALVTDIPGTTRDTIEESLQLGGVALNIIDTAGIRETDDVVESMGVERALEAAQRAELLLWVLDASRPADAEDEALVPLVHQKTAIAVVNKMDIEAPGALERVRGLIGDLPMVAVSVREGVGLDALTETILELFSLGELQPEDLLLSNSRHIHALEEAKRHIEAARRDLEAGIPLDCIEVDVRQAWSHLGEITGETLHEDVLDRIFSSFCVGK